MKLTVAIPASTELSQHLTKLCAKFPEASWASYQECFLPLRHLGNISNYNVLEALDLALLRVTPRPLYLELMGLSLESHGLTDMIFLDVAPTEALLSFRSKIENAVRRSGHTLEKRRYRPRIKIGAVDCNLRAKTINWAQNVNLDAHHRMTADRFCLYECLGDTSMTPWVPCEEYPLSRVEDRLHIALQVPPL